MKTLKVEDAYLMEYETFEDVAVGVPRLRRTITDDCTPAAGYLSPA